VLVGKHPGAKLWLGGFDNLGIFLAHDSPFQWPGRGWPSLRVYRSGATLRSGIPASMRRRIARNGRYHR
jgi:hypothetical protein